MRRAALAAALVPAVACSQPETVDSVDLERYDGLWYEIASYETFFNEDCTGTTAEYGLESDGSVSVVNTCYLGGLDGEEDRIEGVATVADTATNAKLKVSFGFGFPGDYWIIGLGDDGDGGDYPWAVVSDPQRFTLFVLSRETTLDAATYDAILDDLDDQGFDLDDLNLTPQP